MLNTIINKLKQYALILWQLPQYLLGHLLVKLTRAKKRIASTEHGVIEWYYRERSNWFTRFISGVSLGEYIVLPHDNLDTIKHEHGHSIQSLYLGWLYLPVVGIYSAVFCNLWNRLLHNDWNSYDRHYWYYNRWTESWADMLGNVDRDAILRRIPRPEDAQFPAV